MTIRYARLLCALITLPLLSACGGGATREIASLPPTPPPPPPPPAQHDPVLQPEHIGLVSNEPFITFGVGDRYTVSPTGGDETAMAGPDFSGQVDFSYSPATGKYQINLPGVGSGELVQKGLNGSEGQVATSAVLGLKGLESTTSVTLQVPGGHFSPYTYTSFGSWLAAEGKTGTRDTYNEGWFVYGIPAKAADMPLSGKGSYSAQVLGSLGSGYSIPVTGDVQLTFDFGAGSLAGSMHAGIFDEFDGIIKDFGTYDFTQTVYATGSTTFSGRFVVPNLPNGTVDSAFQGAFTGPNATELMARFKAPYSFQGATGTMSGIWIGKRN